MLKFKRAKLPKHLTFTKLLPNLITLSGLVIGFNSIRYAMDGHFETAVVCIIIAACIDGVDGRVARMLNATSMFGAELDSLSDFANFGIAPGIIMYLWLFEQHSFTLLAWSSILLFIICMAIRLARFNTSLLPEETANQSKYFFIGVPAPVGALLMVVPIIISLDLESHFNFQIRSHVIGVAIYQMIIAALLASRLPTWSFKHTTIKPEHVWIYLLLSGLLIINLLVYTWYILPILAIIYLGSLPYCTKLAAQEGLRTKRANNGSAVS